MLQNYACFAFFTVFEWDVELYYIIPYYACFHINYMKY